jgi:hypothetical protein
MSEADLKRTVVDMALEKGWRVYETPQIKPTRPVKRATSKGMSDLILARDEEIRFLEIKDQKGQQSQDQHDWHWAIGPLYEVIRPSDLARGRVDELLA